MSMSKDSGISMDAPYTPVHRRSGSRKSLSTTKKSLFQESRRKEKNDDMSGEDSDLGPMSPLALSDMSDSSSVQSSPGREYASPLPTPDESPKGRGNVNWDRLTPCSPVIPKASPFALLLKTTRAARATPCRRIFPESPHTPRRSPRVKAKSHDIIPETPDKVETPEKKLSTPLGSFNNDSAPKLHRRKSSNHSGPDVESLVSPEVKENKLKRRADTSDITPCNKVAKTDESMTAPKARAALFQEEQPKSSKPKDFTISVDKFYSSKSFNRPHSIGIFDQIKLKKKIIESKKPSRSSSSKKRRRTFGEINAGVSHGIKKKPKRVVTAKELQVKAKKKAEEERKREQEELKKAGQGFAKKLEAASKTKESKKIEATNKANNKFFKSTDESASNVKATIKIGNKIKINVGQAGDLKLDKKFLKPHNKKRPKIVMDATDLVVEEASEVETAVEKSQVADILKLLEDDWADDEMEVSPHKCSRVVPADVLMSPASELSNMTSTMNIDDAAAMQRDVESAGPKYYPLFNKGFQPIRAFEPPDKKSKNYKKWQTSIQAGGAPDQYILDAGQKKFGATECKECGVVYQEGDADDENQHLNYHNYWQKLRFPGWKSERIVFEDPISKSRIINVGPKDHRVHWKKVLDVLEIANAEMGLESVVECSNKQVYLYIKESQIIGILVADDSVREAYRMIDTGDDLINCCTEDAIAAKCGVHAVWTAMKYRKREIATKLVDILRQSLVYGHILTKDDIAFSIPSVSGKLFAQKYTGTKEFKVYK